MIKCEDCGLPYTMFGLDMTLPNAQWERVANESKLLCANCILIRASKIPGVIAARMVLEINPQ